nr:hypothetical protein CFP56_28037 [Quercus suber]POF02428.1 hypothetical protein CFP56_28038 [Quercus suber]
MLPSLFPHNSLVVFGEATILSRHDEPIIGSSHHLGLAFHHAQELQLRLGLLVVFLHRELSDLRHMRLCYVLYRLPPTDENPTAAATFASQGCGSVNRKDEKGNNGYCGMEIWREEIEFGGLD